MDFSIHNLCAGEITTMLSTNRSLEHEQHVYDFAFFVEIAIKKFFPILFEEHMKQYNEKLKIAFETYLNRKKINEGDIAKGVAEILQKAIDDAGQSIKISF